MQPMPTMVFIDDGEDVVPINKRLKLKLKEEVANKYNQQLTGRQTATPQQSARQQFNTSDGLHNLIFGGGDDATVYVAPSARPSKHRHHEQEYVPGTTVSAIQEAMRGVYHELPGEKVPEVAELGGRRGSRRASGSFNRPSHMCSGAPVLDDTDSSTAPLVATLKKPSPVQGKYVELKPKKHLSEDILDHGYTHLREEHQRRNVLLDDRDVDVDGRGVGKKKVTPPASHDGSSPFASESRTDSVDGTPLREVRVSPQQQQHVAVLGSGYGDKASAYLKPTMSSAKKVRTTTPAAPVTATAAIPPRNGGKAAHHVDPFEEVLSSSDSANKTVLQQLSANARNPGGYKTPRMLGMGYLNCPSTGVGAAPIDRKDVALMSAREKATIERIAQQRDVQDYAVAHGDPRATSKLAAAETRVAGAAKAGSRFSSRPADQQRLFF